MNLWEAYLLGKRLKARPSDVYCIDGDWRRFCFDRAILTFGVALEEELNNVEGKTESQKETKRARVLQKWLDQPLKFREPVATQRVQREGSEGS